MIWLAALSSVACTRFHATVAPAVDGFCRLDARSGAEAGPPSDDPFFAGLEVLASHLPTLAHAPGATSIDVRSTRLEALEAEFRPVLPAVGLAATGAFFVHGWSMHVEATPAQCMDVMLDLAAEKAALSADEAEVRGERATRDGVHRVVRLGLLDMGESFFKFDFRWTIAMTSRLRGDGAALVRYDFVRDDRPQRVSAFSGVAMVVPEATGSRVTEIVAVGSTVNPPFFLKSKIRTTVEDILTKRARRLAERMNAH